MIFACHLAMCDTRSSVVWQNAKSPPVSTAASGADTRISPHGHHAECDRMMCEKID
jgi:hypothetical protein